MRVEEREVNGWERKRGILSLGGGNGTSLASSV